MSTLNIDELQAKRDVKGLIRIATNQRKNGQLRSEAIVALGEIRDPQAVEVLVAMVVGREFCDQPLYARAVDALCGIGGPKTNEAVGTALKAEVGRFLRVSIDGTYSPTRTPELGLDTPACMNLVKILAEVADPDAVECLIDGVRGVDIVGFGDEEKYLVHEMFNALVKVGKPAVESLITLLQGWKENRQVLAATSLGEIGDPRAVEPLCALVENGHMPKSREAAIEAVGRLGDPRAIVPLTRVLSDTEHHLGHESVYALNKIGGENIVEPLIQALVSPSPGARKKAAEILNEMEWSASSMEERIASAIAAEDLTTLSESDYPKELVIDFLQKHILKYDAHALGDIAADLVRRLGGTVEEMETGESLVEAVKEGSAAKVNELLSSGTNSDLPDRYGVTALRQAIMNGREEIVELLLAEGANPNYRGGRFPVPALHQAARDSGVCLELLLDAGADPNIRNYKGHTPLDWAISDGDPAKVALLVVNGADVNVGEPWEPLIRALRLGNLEVVRVLLAKSKGLAISSFVGQATIHFVKTRGAPDLAELIRNKIQ